MPRPFSWSAFARAGLLALLMPFALPAQSDNAGDADSTEKADEAAETEPAEDDAEGASQRTQINLLGQTSSESGESRRNENVQFNLVDNNALKELNIRLGATATIVNEFKVDAGFFGAEFGKPPTPPVHAPGGRGSGVHGNVFWRHNNSLFSARSFFQVGGVQPARENFYGGTLSAPTWKGGYITLSGSQNKIRGNVNGNVLAPLPEERTPLTNDPVLRPIVRQLLDAYPNVAPNRPDIAERALNTNSPQQIDTDSARAQLDQSLGRRGKLIFRYALTAQDVNAFQLVVGQNPDTDTKSHSARITWNRNWGANTVTDFSLGFDRLGSLLLPAEGALGPVFTGRALTSLGPFPIIPLIRVQNRFRYGGTLRKTQGRGELTAGFALTRLQYNGEEPDGARGILLFRPNFGNDAITNLRLGLPSTLIASLGSTYRGFRNRTGKFFLGYRRQASQNLTLNLGLRYEPVTRPHDVTGRSDLNMTSDNNNLAGSFGFAYRLGDRWGVLRGAYATQYGDIFPVTYGQDRLNKPHTVTTIFVRPNLADYRANLDPSKRDPAARSSLIEVGPDLTTPYSHQYNFSWERGLGADWRLQLGYVGSRSHKLIITYFLNRAREIPGVESSIANINRRRPRQDIFEHLFIHNGSRGYYDAGRVSLAAPDWKGVSLNASYWFSKALDIGGSYTNTASGPDARNAVSQTEFESHGDLKALSDFDQPHSFLLQLGYTTPKASRGASPLRKIFGGWTASAVALLKTGTPFTVDSGSDGPGFGNVDSRSGDRPMLLDPSILGQTIGDPDTSESLLPRSAFRFIDAPREQAGNLGRNTFRKGKVANVNASLSRRFPLSGDWSMEFRAESINFFNTPQFAEPGKTLTSPNFGQINNTLNDGRTFRFQLRFMW